MAVIKRYSVLGINIDNTDHKEVIKKVKDAIYLRRKLIINFVNPQTTDIAQKDSNFKKIINEADIILSDGIGIVWSLKLLHSVYVEQISADRLAPHLFNVAASKGFSIFLFGSEKWVLNESSKSIMNCYPELKVAGVLSPPFIPISEMNNHDMINIINESKPDILLVSLGSPKQEQWIELNKKELNVPVIICVGGLLDYWAGKIKYAPKWIHNLNIVWIYRIIQEPRRLWKRYLIGNLLFLIRIFMQRLKLRSYKLSN